MNLGYQRWEMTSVRSPEPRQFDRAGQFIMTDPHNNSIISLPPLS
jgi:hypothetical protein